MIRRALIAFAVVMGSVRPALPQATVSVHLTLGNPSQAKADPGSPNNYLVLHDQWAASWNCSKGHPNWVSWRLCADDAGDADRTDVRFEPDSSLPNAFPKIIKGLYGGYGYDLGHICPSGDRSSRIADLRATFLTTNCFPQAPALNRGTWRQMEAYRRRRACDEGQELYVISGPAGTAGRGETGYRTTIGDDSRRVNVPALCWAIWVELPDRKGNDLERIDRETIVYAVIFNNGQDPPQNWRQAHTTIAEIEQLTEFDFLSELDRKLQRTLESQKPALDAE